MFAHSFEWLSPVFVAQEIAQVYTVSKFAGQSQAIVKLNCLEGKALPWPPALHRCAMHCSGQEYAGHLCADAKSAEKSAAEQALQATLQAHEFCHKIESISDLT